MKNENGQFKRGSLIKDLTGEKFNKWEVIEFSHVDYGKKIGALIGKHNVNVERLK